MIPETVSKLLDLGLGLRISNSDEKGCARIMASTPMKMSIRLEGIQQVYPNAVITKIEEEWGMGFYTVKLND